MRLVAAPADATARNAERLVALCRFERPAAAAVTSFQLDWTVQVTALGNEAYLVIAQRFVRRKLLAVEIDIEWFLDWRNAFRNFVGGLPAEGEYEMDAMHPAHAFTVLDEVLGVDLFG